MGQPPLPPHERPWRHPSEVAAAASEVMRREPAPAHVRTVAAVTGLGGLLVIALVVLAVTPRGDTDPELAGGEAARVTAEPAALTLAPATGTSTRPLATPVGDGLALAPAEPFDGIDRRVVDLPDGSRVTADVVERVDDVVVLQLAGDGGEPFPVADRAAGRAEPVQAITPDPVDTTLGRIAELDLAHGTPVVDLEGQLVAICDGSADGVIHVDDDVAAAIASAAPAP
ncbi:MAG: hypothetical protein MUE78_06560 [Ilumatobacteraceae bacterium]|nr:hypothetical protein [Ilumatobacteraceae bacterium]